MPREAQFDVREKLGKALELFWRQGYHATSMADIKAELDLNPGSIYSAFGNKRDLYIKSLELYEKSVDFLFETINKLDSPIEHILYIFNSVVKDIEASPECKGCFMLNASLEVAPHDREIQLLADKANQRMKHFFKEQILKGQTTDEIPGSVDADTVSETLVLILYGMRVRSRSNPPAREFEKALKQVKLLLSA